MFDYQTVKLLHRHGNDDYAPFAESSEHSSASHDPERAWLKGARLFRCTKCEDEVVITVNGEPSTEHPFEGA